ncbi:MAG: acyltransferase family protein [Candidatus Promineifilaceae bacterium]
MIKKEGGAVRRYELDWLRVIAIFLVFVFHSGRFFDPSDWHVKSSVTYPQLEPLGVFIVSWIMPLIFVISGASVFFASGKSGSGKFLQSKVARLLVPLTFAAFTHLPLQVYLERVSHHQFTGSFWAFLPHYFEGIYGWNNGNFAITGMHLWYLWLLFLFTMVFAPLFSWARHGNGRFVLKRVGDFLALPGLVYLLFVPVYLFMNWLNPNKGVGQLILGGWSFLLFIPFYLAGFVLYSHDGLVDRIRRQRWISLVGGLLCMVFLYLQISDSGIPLWGTDRYRVLTSVYCLNSWFWILAFLGFAQQHLTFQNPFLKYANEAVLPFYIMHQTVLLVVGYIVLQQGLPDAVDYVVIAAVSLTIIMVLYEFVIRRINILRLLFGMKLLPGKELLRRGEPALRRI